ncbi:hypothetical protein EVAR_29139_1 [Eumeta japonica]|uniref:Uncharacterized protein n=1 Tax=Eumeta variegata TaxID=151549 RepID=A0A4C1VAY9_EUMVA|nr:hypothetical protein EVAR_29139_1 [Eumeta japonica]
MQAAPPTTTDVQSALVRPPRRLPDAEVSDAARLPRCRRRGACPDIVGTIILIVNRCFGAPRRSEERPTRGPGEEEDTGSLTRAWLSRAPPSSTTTPLPGRGSLTRTALAAIGCVDSLISGRQARSVRSTPSGSPMRAALIGRRPPASDHRRSAACAACSVPPSRPRQLPLHNPVPPPPAIERIRDDARARGWSGVGTGSTPRQGTERREEVEGRGSLTRTALAAVVRCLDNLISGRQARSVRSTPTRVTDACRLDPVGVHQRPTTGGRLRVQLELRLPPTLVEHQLSSRMPPSTCRLRIRDDRARSRAVRRRHRHDSRSMVQTIAT